MLRNMNKSEILAKLVFKQLLYTLKEVEDQSNGEHDFDIIAENGSCVGVVEVTSGIHEESKRWIARKRKHGTIKCNTLKSGWLLMCHNPDLRWVKSEGCKHLAILEDHGLKEFSHDTKYSQTEKVAVAATSLLKNGFENGCELGGGDGVLSFIVSHGEHNGPNLISAKSVVDSLLVALEKPDNSHKLAQKRHPAHYSRHLFVEIDNITQPEANISMIDGELPSAPLDLDSRATNVWAATRYRDKIIVWGGDFDGWNKWELDSGEIYK